MSFQSIPHKILMQAQSRPSASAYFERIDGDWRPVSWGEYGARLKRVARSMMALGLESGQQVGILGFNRPEWVLFDVAAMSIGACPAGIYTTSSPEEVQYILSHSEAQLVLLENEEQWEKVQQVWGELPELKYVVMMKGSGAIEHERVLSWRDFLAKADEVEESAFDERLAALKPEQLATLIYTSGTTGPPKGVMLSHDNLAWTAETALKMVGVDANGSVLSYLPLSHIAEQMFTVHAAATAGYAVYYAESIADVPSNLKEVQPTLFFGVPRIWEKFHAVLSTRLDAATGVKANLVRWSMGVGREVNQLRNQGKVPTGMLALKFKLADKLLAKVREAAGLGRAVVCVSGAAPIGPDVLEFFSNFDLTIQEVYGQSEDCGPTTFNMAGNIKIGSVGSLIDGVNVKIADDGEVLVSGRNVFLGYFKNQEATDETLIDGWLHSGDLGTIDEDGFLHITGRKKDIIITAGGKNIAPKNIEAALKEHRMINEAVVVGDRRKYLVALVTIDPDAAAEFAAAQGVSEDELWSNEALNAELQKHVDNEVNPRFARVEQVKKFAILKRNLSIEDGELTATMKVKRAKVHAHFADDIETLYAG